GGVRIWGGAASPNAERSLFEATISDLERSRLTLPIVNAMPAGYVLHGLKHLGDFSRDARFRALLEACRPLTVIERYFVLKRREDGRSGPAGCRRARLS